MAQFVKGVSGNPKGRPKKIVEEAKHSLLSDLFDVEAEREIIENILSIAKTKPFGMGGANMASSAIAAATWLWDRKYGKVKEQVENTGDLNIRLIYVDGE